MQAFAKTVSGKMDNSIKPAEMSLEERDNSTSMLSANEIIFPDETSESIHTRYGYKVSGMNFLIPEKTTSEVIQNQNIFRLPNSPIWVEGLINIRGNIIPVMNIEKLLKSPTTNSINNILVMDKSDSSNTIAILINDLPVSLEYNDSKSSVKNLPETLQDYIGEGFTQNGADWIEFSPHKLFENLAVKVKV